MGIIGRKPIIRLTPGAHAVSNPPSICLFYLYSRCSHLEHRASVKRFVSFQFPNLRQSVGLFGRGISSSQFRYLHRTIQTQKKRRQISMPWVGFETTIPVFKRAKRFHVLDGAAIAISNSPSLVEIKKKLSPYNAKERVLVHGCIFII
jgi:hypothetical protein